jgi:hypothetical protein
MLLAYGGVNYDKCRSIHNRLQSTALSILLIYQNPRYPKPIATDNAMENDVPLGPPCARRHRREESQTSFFKMPFSTLPLSSSWTCSFNSVAAAIDAHENIRDVWQESSKD